MWEVQFVMKRGCHKDGGGFRTKDQWPQGGGAKSGGTGAARFRRGKVAFRADQHVDGGNHRLLFGLRDESGEGAGLRLKGADDAGDGRGQIRGGQKSIERCGFGDFG